MGRFSHAEKDANFFKEFPDDGNPMTQSDFVVMSMT